MDIEQPGRFWTGLFVDVCCCGSCRCCTHGVGIVFTVGAGEETVIFDEMRSDAERARHTGDQLGFVIFWGFAWGAWIGMALFFGVMIWRFL